MAVTLDSLRKAVKKNKGRSQALAWLADMERASGDYEAALKTVDEALAASPSDVSAMLVRAKILAGQQDFAGSIVEYKKVLAKDPFCLSAHKRMGESYDKLGKEAERNACFRRVHDMDPLDPFWKDEYDVLSEEEQAAMVPPMDDSSFTMDMSDDSENPASGEDDIFANLAASLPNTDEEDNASMDDLRNSLNFASGELSKENDSSEAADFDGHMLNSSEVSSAISGILGGDDDLELGESAEKDEPAAEEPATSSLFSHFSDESEKAETVEEPKSEDIPEELIDEPHPEAAEEKSDEAEFSLDSLDEPLDADEKATNVDDAFSSLLGDDELPEENANEPVDSTSAEPEAADELTEPAAESVVPAEHMDFSNEEDVGAADLLSLDESPKSEESETNVDDAFSSLLGDDELPEENANEPVESASSEPEKTEESAEAPAEEESFGSLFEKSADADFSLNDDASSDTASASTDSAIEEAPAEPAVEESVTDEVAESATETPAEEESFGSLFEKSADADFSLNDETVEPAAETPVEENAEISDIAETALEKAPEFTPTESAENVAPVEGLVPTSHMDFSDDEDIPKADDDFVLNLDDETSAEEKAAEVPASESIDDSTAETLEEPAEESVENVTEEDVAEASAEENSAAEEVDGAFDALFGDEEETPAAEETVAEEASADVPVDASTSSATENVDEIAETPVEEQPVDESSKDEDLAKEMGGAFASMFGDDDSALAESAPVDDSTASASEDVEESLSQEATGAEIEESAVKEDVEKSVDESFDSIFGADADDLPEEKSEVAEAPAEEIAEAPAEEPSSVFSAPVESLEEPSDETLEEPAAEQLEEPVAETAEQVAEESAPSAELDSIDSEVSNAFKGLFDEDDSLPESDEPNNNGVDYLMSGDSDDEVAASLVENADAPLSRGATDLDDSLNTRTLADIYMEQGVYDKALEIYSDLAKKNPDNEEIKSRLEEVKKLCREKFGEV